MVLSKKVMNTMRRIYLVLPDEDGDYLITLSEKRTIQAQIVDRAQILLFLLYKSEGMSFSDIAENLLLVRPLYVFVFLNIMKVVLKMLFLIPSVLDVHLKLQLMQRHG